MNRTPDAILQAPFIYQMIFSSLSVRKGLDIFDIIFKRDSGPTCMARTNHCSGNGKCISDMRNRGDFICQCNTGYDGTECQIAPKQDWYVCTKLINDINKLNDFKKCAFQCQAQTCQHLKIFKIQLLQSHQCLAPLLTTGCH